MVKAWIWGGGLQGFFRLGDSNKLSNPITEKGRRKIGKFGIATILLKYLAQSYILETFRNGQRIVVEEEFNGSLASDRPIPYNSFSADRKLHGTRIEMRDLNFTEGERFSLGELRRRVSWELPIAPDFKVVINGEQVQSKFVDTATEYRFEKTGEKPGKVSGVIYVTKRPTKDAGVHIYVNGRRVGDPNYFQLHKIKATVSNRLVGLISADGIEDAILFDRGRFKEDDFGFLEMAEIVRKVLHKVVYDVRRTSHQNRQRTAAEKVNGLLKRIDERISEKTGKGITVELGQTDSIVPVIGDGKLILSEESPVFNPTRDVNIKEYGLHVVHAVAEALATEKVPKGSRETVRRFLAEKQRLVEELLETVSPEPEQINESGFSDYRMYSPLEIARMSGRSRGEIEKMIESGFVSADDGMIKGENAMSALRRVDGYTSLWSVVTKMDLSNPTLLYRSRTDQLETYGESLPFILDVGKTERCFFIKNEFVEDVKKVLESGETNLKRKTDRNPLERVADRYLTVVEMSQSLGLETTRVGEVIDYANRKGLSLRTQREKGMPRFNYLDVARAAQSMGAI